MNIAFSTILIFLFIIPGLAFRRFYYTGEFSKEYFKSTGFGIFALGVLPALLLHWAGMALVRGLTPVEIDFLFTSISIPPLSVDLRLLGMLLTGKASESYLNQTFENIHSNINYIFSYNLFITVTGATLGFLTNKMVRIWKLDRRIKILRFQNEWHYILTAEVLDFPNVRKTSPYDKKNKKISSIFINALVNIGEKEGGILYSGFLEDYKLSKDGGLDLIYLTRAYRRFIRDDSNAKDWSSENDQGVNPYYVMPEHYFILKYSEVKNLNIFYDFQDKKKRLKLDLEIILGIIVVLIIYSISIYFLDWLLGGVLGTILIWLISRLGEDEEED